MQMRGDKERREEGRKEKSFEWSRGVLLGLHALDIIPLLHVKCTHTKRVVLSRYIVVFNLVA